MTQARARKSAAQQESSERPWPPAAHPSVGGGFAPLNVMMMRGSPSLPTALSTVA
jgi:hypothetical protein